MFEVVRAILLDDEARGDSKDPTTLPNYGKLREPVQFITNVLRGFNAKSDGVLDSLNVSGSETLSIRLLAESFGQRLGKPPVFTGVEAPEAWLVNTAQATRLFGYPSVPLGKLVDWTADWVARGMPSLGKDTHYDVRDGDF